MSVRSMLLVIILVLLLVVVALVWPIIERQTANDFLNSGSASGYLVSLDNFNSGALQVSLVWQGVKTDYCTTSNSLKQELTDTYSSLNNKGTVPLLNVGYQESVIGSGEWSLCHTEQNRGTVLTIVDFRVTGYDSGVEPLVAQ